MMVTGAVSSVFHYTPSPLNHLSLSHSHTHRNRRPSSASFPNPTSSSTTSPFPLSDNNNNKKNKKPCHLFNSLVTEIAKELLTNQLSPGNSASKITKPPPLQGDGPPSDYYGRLSNTIRHRRPRRGGVSAWSMSQSGSRGGWDDGLNSDDDEDIVSRRGGSFRNERPRISRSSGDGDDRLTVVRRRSRERRIIIVSIAKSIVAVAKYFFQYLFLAAVLFWVGICSICLVAIWRGQQW